MTFENIPDELKTRIQFCVWRYELLAGETKPTKVPYNPKTGAKISTTDPQTWCAFGEAIAAVSRFDGLGFVFSARDEYCGIDLDDPYAIKEDGSPKFPLDKQVEIATRHTSILAQIPGYAEWSPSGRGIHIIAKGKVPHGRRRDAVEVYSDMRYFTMTGNVFRSAPIVDANEKINLLWSQMAPADRGMNGFVPEFKQENDDDKVYDMAATAANGDKFVALYNGNWEQYYASQSEADFALIDIIAFYTQFTPQIMRMFRDSALGKRKKAERDDYVTNMISRAFDNQVPPIDYSALIDNFNAARAAAHSPTVIAGGPAPVLTDSRAIAGGAGLVDRLDRAPTAADSVESWSLSAWRDRKPPGFLSVLLDYIYASSARPVYEISLIAALGLMSGVVGRQYNISKTGLNQYYMLIADTGKGKDAIASGIARIVTATKKHHERITEIYGPAQIMSGQALIKYLGGKAIPCFISLTGEFGIRLKQITEETATSADKTLLMVLLDLYMKSGAGQTVQPSIYADKANNTEQINSPAFTLIGETTGEKFYEALDESAVTSGLLPRFLTVEYNGSRPPLNHDAESLEVPPNLSYGLAEIFRHCEDLAQHGRAVICGQDSEARALLTKLDKHCDYQINHASRNLTRELWNRVHLKTMRLAALLAVSVNYSAPMITADMVEWAASMILTDIYRLLGKFERGEMGTQNVSDNAKQFAHMRKVIGNFCRKPFELLPAYGARQEIWKVGIIQNSYISRACISFAAFRNDKRGSTNAINATVKQMIDEGYLKIANSKSISEEFKYEGKCFQIVDVKWFLEADHL
jgi:hypothetical protein